MMQTVQENRWGDGLMASLENQFDAAMIDVYKRVKAECGYNAVRFLRMVTEIGGLETARQLINANTPSDGYTFLWQHGRLDLAVEAVAIQPQFTTLFTPKEIEAAQNRLAEYGYQASDPA